ncbi:MAG: TIGR02757 family protein [Desulfobacterales bacterium]|nr:TIGR02757 family protein [Desulfobacterales bacterium]
MKHRLDALYCRYNRFDLIHPDPLEFLHQYPDPEDREIVGMIASALAYGRVGQILKSVGSVLGIMGPSPLEYVHNTSPGDMAADLSGFVHRFARGDHLVALLTGIKRILLQEGSLQACFLAGYRPGHHDDALPAMIHLADRLTDGGRLSPGHLMADPGRGSACKRLSLFLRWMVRCDQVDPGGWQGFPAAKLIVPLDVHMHRVCRQMGLTRRNQADMRTAREVTCAFRRWAPEDPVRYDFALTRFGIRGEADAEGLFAALTVAAGPEDDRPEKSLFPATKGRKPKKGCNHI